MKQATFAGTSLALCAGLFGLASPALAGVDPEACCLPNQTCVDLPAEDCSGTPLGTGTTCAQTGRLLVASSGDSAISAVAGILQADGGEGHAAGVPEPTWLLDTGDSLIALDFGGAAPTESERVIVLGRPGGGGLIVETLIPDPDLRELRPFDTETEARKRLVTQLGAAVRMTGVIQAIHYDDFDNGRWVDHYWLEVGEVSFRLHLPEPMSLDTGDQTEVSGIALGRDFVVDEIRFLARAGDVHPTYGSTIGEQPTIVLLANFIDDRSEPVSHTYVYRKIFDETEYQSLAQYVDEVSYGRAWVTGDVYPASEWYQLPFSKTDGCSRAYTDILTAVVEMADPVVEFVEHARLVILFPNSIGCPSSAGRKFDVPTDEGVFDLTIMVLRGSHDLTSGGSIHEFGHLLSLKHANGWECGATTIGPDCESVYYGDILDVMGYHPGKSHFNLVHKLQINWLSDEEILDLSADATGLFRIGNLEVLGDLPLGLRIELPDGLHYTVEYRRPVGFDAVMNQFSNVGVYEGAILHYDYVHPQGLGDSQLLDASPHVNPNGQVFNDFTDSVLRLWSTFEDEENGIRITPVSGTDDYLDVCIGSLRGCGVLPEPPQVVGGARKCRVISFEPGNEGRSVGFVVQRSDQVNPDWYWGVLEPNLYLERQFVGKGGRSSIGGDRYSFKAASLSGNFTHIGVWDGVGTLHVTGQAVAPFSSYLVYAFPEGCDSLTCLTDPLLVETARWGDVNDDGTVDMSDIDEVVRKVKNRPECMSKLYTKLAGVWVDFYEDVDDRDLEAVIAAFEGQDYPYGTASFAGENP